MLFLYIYLESTFPSITCMFDCCIIFTTYIFYISKHDFFYFLFFYCEKIFFEYFHVYLYVCQIAFYNTDDSTISDDQYVYKYLILFLDIHLYLHFICKCTCICIFRLGDFLTITPTNIFTRRLFIEKFSWSDGSWYFVD